MTEDDDGAGSVGGDKPLRAELAALDPTRPGGPVPVVDLPPDHLEELIMSTTAHDPAAIDRDEPVAVTAPSRGRGRWLAAAAALVLVVAGVVGGAMVLSDAQKPISDQPRGVALTTGPAGAMSSCVRFDVTYLKDMPVALAGTVTEVGGDTVTLTVDRWYRGSAEQEQATTVTISTPGGATSAALDGVDFEQGMKYLVTATNGTVNGCGFSGPAAPQLEASYREAFGG